MDELAGGTFTTSNWLDLLIINHMMTDDLVEFQQTLKMKLDSNDVNPPSDYPASLFNLMEEAVWRGALKITKYLITTLGVDVNMPSIYWGPTIYGDDNVTPLSLSLSLSRGERPNRKEMVKLLISAGANITEDDSVRIKALFGENVSDILKSLSKEASDRRMAAVVSWRRDRMPPPPPPGAGAGANSASPRKGGRRSTRRSRRASKKHRSRNNRH